MLLCSSHAGLARLHCLAVPPGLLAQPPTGLAAGSLVGGVSPLAGWDFFFFYLKNIKISKIYVRFKIFQKYPLSPYGVTGSCRPSHGRQDPNVIFFGICKEVPGPGEGACRAPNGRQGPVAPQGRQGRPTLYKPWPPFSCHLSLKIQKKKRGVRRRKAEKLFRIPHL